VTAQGKADLVIAFPGGRGTANMMKQAREAGVLNLNWRKPAPVQLALPPPIALPPPLSEPMSMAELLRAYDT
jgi:hypothetical protein